MSKNIRSAALLTAALWSGGAAAQVTPFGIVYNLPIPFWLYAYGAAAALVVSFVVVGYFIKVQPETLVFRSVDLGASRLAQAIMGRVVVAALRVVSVCLLLVCIAAGLFGTWNPFLNFNMTFFWIIFLLGLAYLTALVGDIYAVINPWRAVCGWIERIKPEAFRQRRSYPNWLGYYPALLLYMLLIWIQIFGMIRPFALSCLLIAYGAINLLGAALVGKQAWFRYAEIFAVFFRLIGKMAPVEYLPASGREDAYRLRLRPPFVGLLEEPAEHASLLLFVLFMLSSTAFDGVHQTRPWVLIFWKHIYPVITAGSDLPYLYWLNYYYYWQWAMLIVSPFVYLAIYLFFIWLAKLVTRSKLSARAMALHFALSLVPIAFVYNVTHNGTLLLSQGVYILRMISDPLGIGWNLFGTAGLMGIQAIEVDANIIWHAQVGLILFGHIASVYLAHVEALKIFPNVRQAELSQFPMLLLMVLFTTIGLWILSLPIEAGQVMQPLPTG